MSKPETKKPNLIQLLLDEQQAREKNCAQEIDKLLVQYNCRVEVAMLIKQNSATPQITIVANPTKPDAGS